MRKVRVAIVGAGTAGLTALAQVRRRTEEFVIINEGPYGTTCARVGCMPSKALIHIANDFYRRKRFAEVGIEGTEALRVDLPKALAWVRAYRDERVADSLRATVQVGERNLPGRAEFLAPNELRILRVDGGEERIQADAVILAPGSQPVIPRAWTHFSEQLLTTDTLFEQCDLPPRIAVLGLGAIGLEIGQALARLGLEVHGFELRERLGALTDPELIGLVIEHFSHEFVLHLGAAAELRPSGTHWQVGSAGMQVEVDAVLIAFGRRPCLDGLGLECLGVPRDARGLLPVDPHTLRVADLPVFLVGDANARSPVMHEASDDGYIAAVNALEGPTPFARRVPLVMAFTDPEIAIVGASFESLAAGSFEVAGYDFSRQTRAIAMRHAEGRLRVYAKCGSGRLLGAEIFTPEGEHLAHLLALAIERGLSVAELLRMPIYHPVLEEGLRSALRILARKLYGHPPQEFRSLP